MTAISRRQSWTMGVVLAFALVTYAMPFGATFLVALVAALTLRAAPPWWRATVGAVAAGGIFIGLALTYDMLVLH